MNRSYLGMATVALVISTFSCKPQKQSKGPEAKPQVNVSLADVGLDDSAMDLKANPCDDFYQFACGGWLDSTIIPEDKSRYGRFTEIFERNEEKLHAILESSAQHLSQVESSDQKLGRFYNACMDEENIERLGGHPIQPVLALVKEMGSSQTIEQTLGTLHKHGIMAPFSVSPVPDFKDVTQMIMAIDQGGLGLPDKDYYTAEDRKGLRESYKKHISSMMMLAGENADLATNIAKTVLEIETLLAQASKSRTELRDPTGVYNPMTLQELLAKSNSFNWQQYMERLGSPDSSKVTLDAPAFFVSMTTLFAQRPKEDWKHYLSWHVVQTLAPMLSKPFVQLHYDFKKELSGISDVPKRWKRCVASTEASLGELLAQPFIEKMFSGDAKIAADEMVTEVSNAFRNLVDGLPWMSPETKVKALEKLSKMEYLVGYPDVWKKYDFEVKDGAYVDNVLKSWSYNTNQELGKIGKPVDRSLWYMTPQTVNAYYHPLHNHMVFPAGILQTPFFNAFAHEPVNLGAIGMVVGHELTHGFDDKGSQFDGLGNLSNWWAETDRVEFEKRGQCMVNQYATYESLPGHHLNGELTLGENIADSGGVKLAFAAYKSMSQKRDSEKIANGFNEDQQFFISTGQAWCSKYREEEAKRRVLVDSHSPPRFRVNGTLSNLPEFKEAFQCELGTPMAPENTCEIW